MKRKYASKLRYFFTPTSLGPEVSWKYEQITTDNPMFSVNDVLSVVILSPD